MRYLQQYLTRWALVAGDGTDLFIIIMFIALQSEFLLVQIENICYNASHQKRSP